MVTDITYIRTYEGFLYLAVVPDLFLRQIVGWATRSTPHTDLVLQALLAAVWRRKPKAGLLLHSDQGCQFTSQDWQSKAHGIVCSMSRRATVYRQRRDGKLFPVTQTRADQAKDLQIRKMKHAADVFDYIVMFLHPETTTHVRHGAVHILSKGPISG